MKLPDYGEVVIHTAAEEFRKEFEAALRKRLLDIATAEIEHIVREVSDGMGMSFHAYDDARTIERVMTATMRKSL